MAGYFDPEDHDEFTRYVVANQRHFDEIEAQYIASKAAGNETGSIHSLFHHINLVSSNIFVVVSGGTKSEKDVGGSTENAEGQKLPDVGGQGCAEHTAVGRGSGRPQRSVASKVAKK